MVICALCLIGGNACRKDLGNYEYRELKTMDIQGFEQVYEALSGQPFHVDPKLDFMKEGGFNEDDFNYEWFSFDENMKIDDGNLKKQLGMQRILDLNLPLTPSTYSLYFRVKDKVTGYVREFKTKLNVRSEIADGWMILNEIRNESRLDMLAYNAKDSKFLQYTDLLSTMSTIKLKGKPRMVYFVYNRDVFNYQFTNRIYVGTDQETYSINNQQRTWNNFRNLKVEVMRPTSDDYHAEVIRSMGMGGFPMTYLLDSDGILSIENSTQGFMHGMTLNRFVDGGRISISPYIAEKYRTITPYLLMFDTEKRRFLVHSGGNKGVIQPVSTDVNVFDPADLKKDLRYMGFVNSGTPQFYAILKEPQQDNFSLLRFVSPSDTKLTPIAYEAIPNAIHLKDAEQITFDPNYGFIMYSIGSKVYQYDPFNKLEKILLDMGNRKISLIKFQKLLQVQNLARYIDYSKKLMICTYDPAAPDNSGKMELYEISLTAAPKLFQQYEGFGKIVDATYRE
ncbi:PKD-like family protein [Pedobacter nyackensis]|uniref:PKD-like family protein n=2 Tax=Pedobacter nyackensis TaxID=475255 RepID=A0A1W2BC95_9SPHI|nr:PKD-like family protein [Pedobacter nyackensis]